jgi:hypothetical protein
LSVYVDFIQNHADTPPFIADEDDMLVIWRIRFFDYSYIFVSKKHLKTIRTSCFLNVAGLTTAINFRERAIFQSKITFFCDIGLRGVLVHHHICYFAGYRTSALDIFFQR